MHDRDNLRMPARLAEILRATAEYGFPLASEPLTGSLLRTLAATKPNGRFLEIGTGTGVGTCWILDGMDVHSRLVTVEQDADVSAIARAHLGSDSRVQFVTADAEEFLQNNGDEQYDFIFADTYPGKFHLLDETLQTLAAGGLYIVDDLLPQATWSEGHQLKVDGLVAMLEGRHDLQITKLNWASGLIVAVKKSLPLPILGETC
jgi:predicted O-methyltransferase YrrM